MLRSTLLAASASDRMRRMIVLRSVHPRPSSPGTWPVRTRGRGGGRPRLRPAGCWSARLPGRGHHRAGQHAAAIGDPVRHLLGKLAAGRLTRTARSRSRSSRPRSGCYLPEHEGEDGRRARHRADLRGGPGGRASRPLTDRDREDHTHVERRPPAADRGARCAATTPIGSVLQSQLRRTARRLPARWPRRAPGPAVQGRLRRAAGRRPSGAGPTWTAPTPAACASSWPGRATR